MNLDEAICHSEEVAKGYEEDISKWKYTLSEYRKRECVEQTTIPRCEKALDRCKQCASEHRQLAEWLKDYKRLLEQEPSVSENPNNCDLISREAVLENAFKIYTHECGLVEVVGVATIKELPSVKPQAQTGHWIIMGDRYIKCSECGHITKTESPDIYHFCMVCGANMSENPTGSKPEISSYYGLKSYVRERSDKE